MTDEQAPIEAKIILDIAYRLHDEIGRFTEK